MPQSLGPQRSCPTLSTLVTRLNPYAEYMYDGINLSPYEVMFVKIKDYLLQANWTTATQVKKYTDWARDHVRCIRVCVCV